MNAAVSADKGVPFDFTNNQKLKESGFALEGVVVNGFVNENGVTININSAKALNSVVGHEITHVLEGTDLYAPMAEIITQHAKSKGEYDSRLEAITKLYEGRDANIEQELVADLVGDYLFSDPDFIRSLSTEHRNVFQKLYDEVKYLCKAATAGSKEARELEKVKKVFAELYREAETKNPTADGGARYALSGRKTPTYEEITAEKAVHIVDVTGDIESGSYADMKASVQRKASEEGWFNRPHHNEDTDSLIFLTPSSFSHAYSNLTGSFGEDTIRTMAHIPEVIKDARLLHVAEPKDPTKAESKVYTFIGAIKGVNGVEPVKLTVKEFDFDTINRVPKNIREYFEKNGVPESYDTLYDAHALEVIGIEGIKKEPDASGKGYGENPQAQATSGSDISVADLLNLVNGDARKYVPQPTAKLSLSAEDSSAPVRGGIYGKDIALAPVREDIAQPKSEQNLLWQALTAISNEGKTTVQSNTKQHISMEDYANQDSPVFKNVDYNDEATKAAIMQQTHDAMVAEGAVVTVSESVTSDVEQAFPDLRSMKKKDRNPILKTAMTKLKNDLRQFLNGFKNQNFEFEVNGKVLDATLYNTGINEVLEKVTKDKASMLYSTEGIFQNARYLYSTQDYDGDPNVYRWNYFYTPVQIGDQTVGVRIAVRDLAKQGESQIYNWGIKKNASLGGVRDDLDNRKPYDASSDASKDIIPQSEPDVNQDNMQKEEDPLYGPWRMKDLLDIGVEKLYRMMLREQISEED